MESVGSKVGFAPRKKNTKQKVEMGKKIGKLPNFTYFI